MIVADTSALVTLASAEVIETVVDEFEVHTTQVAVSELRDTAEHEDVHGEAAQWVLEQSDNIEVHETDDSGFEPSRIDEGEASCIVLTRQIEPDFLITDDLRALPEVKELVEAKVAISPIVLRALVKRGVLDSEQAEEKLSTIAERRGWLGAPIYRRAKALFDS
jgi:predicted nucleic acid-binding protein